MFRNKEVMFPMQRLQSASIICMIGISEKLHNSASCIWLKNNVFNYRHCVANYSAQMCGYHSFTESMLAGRERYR